MSVSTTETLAGSAGGGLPRAQARSASITITDRLGDRVTVSTWATCPGVSEFVAGLLGEPGARAEAPRG